MAIRQVTVPYARGFDFGVGAEMAAASPKGMAVEGEPTGVAGGGGAVMQFTVRRITSTEELERSLGIDAEASYGCGAFGGGIDARFSFAKSARVHSSGLFMTVVARIELGFMSIDAPKLTHAAAQLAHNQKQFAERYGDTFVRGIGSGGLFVGFLRIESTSSEESNNISAEIKGSYGLFSAKAETKFAELTRKYRNEIFVDIHQEGGGIERIENPDTPLVLLEGANRFLEAFQRERERVAVPYFVTLAPMTVAEGPLPLNEADVQHMQDVLAACAKARSRLIDKINLLEYVLGDEEKFDFPEGTSPAALREALAAYQADLDLVAATARSAINAPADAKMPASFAEANGTRYPRGELPNPMPVPKDAPEATVPSFDGCRSWEECNAKAVEAGLTAQQTFAAMPEGDAFRILNVAPPAGTRVPERTVVTIVTQRTKISSWLEKVAKKVVDPHERPWVVMHGGLQGRQG